jgi:hypothetical protein
MLCVYMLICLMKHNKKGNIQTALSGSLHSSEKTLTCFKQTQHTNIHCGWKDIYVCLLTDTIIVPKHTLSVCSMLFFMRDKIKVWVGT